MVTNNFKKLIFSYLLNSGSINTSQPYARENVEVVRTDGTTSQLLGSNTRRDAYSTNINCLNNISTSTTDNGTMHVKVGTGTATPTADDYELESINSDVTVSVAATASTNSHSKIYTVTLNNATTNDINITEIGLYGMLADYYGTALGCHEILLDRTVIDTPITIPAGESKAITYELGF